MCQKCRLLKVDSFLITAPVHNPTEINEPTLVRASLPINYISMSRSIICGDLEMFKSAVINKYECENI